MRKVVAYPAMLASAVGMLLCVFSYLGWLTGSYRFPRREPPLLFIGIFVVWLPTVLLLNTLTRDFKQKDLWKAALRGCPRSEEHTSELQSRGHLVCRLLL